MKVVGFPVFLAGAVMLGGPESASGSVLQGKSNLRLCTKTSAWVEASGRGRGRIGRILGVRHFGCLRLHLQREASPLGWSVFCCVQQ